MCFKIIARILAFSAAADEASMKMPKSFRRIAFFLFTLGVMLCLSAASAYAQCALSSPFTTWNVTSGNWNSSLNWNGGIPNSLTNACLTNGTAGTPATTTLDIVGAAVLSLQVGQCHVTARVQQRMK